MHGLIGFPDLVGEKDGKGNSWQRSGGEGEQTFASVCLAPVYGLNKSIVARGK